MEEKIKTVNLKLEKPDFKIGQKVYIPQKNRVTEASVLGYEIVGYEDEDGNNGELAGVVKDYAVTAFITPAFSEDLTVNVPTYNIFSRKNKAEKASIFLEVKLREETWLRAIGDRDVRNIESPYNIENSDLPSCCGNISQARDFLMHCKKRKGLIVLERDWLNELLKSHDYLCDPDSYIARIFKKLEMTDLIGKPKSR